MSLLLNGAKTVTIAGTQMQCLEIYTGESYTFPLSFTDGNGAPVDCTGWSLSPTAKWYTCTITYPTPGINALYQDEIVISNLALDVPQPSAGASANLAAAFTTAALGEGYIYVPNTITGGFGTPNASPTPTVTDTDSILVILTIAVSRTDPLSGQADVNREPLGMILRYQ
jgi:hypothetical protein